MKIGAVIRKRRKAHDINLSELALRSGIDAGNLSRIERGMQNHTPEKLDAIAAVLGTTASELMAEAEMDQSMNNNDIRESPEKEERELCRYYWSMRPDLRVAYRQIGAEMARAAHG